MIHELIRQLVMWIYQHPNWAGLALFLLSAGESMTLVGSFIPGTVVMTAVGIFVGAELLPYWPMVLWAACGTLFGDALNFTLGYYLKDNIKNVWPFKTRQHWLTKGQYFFEAHGGKSIYFARFIGPLRAFAPIIAGAMRMPAGKFYFIDTLSAFTWAIIYLLPGVLLGEASLELSPDITEHLFRFVFLTLIILIVSTWMIRLLVLHINDVVKNALACLWTKIKETPSLNVIGRWFRHHQNDHPRGQLGTLFVFIIVGISLIICTACVYLNCTFITLYNSEIYHVTQSLHMPWLNQYILITTLLGQKEIIGIVFLVAFAWMGYQHSWRAACFLAGAFIFGVVGAYLLKASIHFHRPNLAFEMVDGFSYPSGHVVIATLFYGGLAYLVAHHMAIKHRWAIYTFAICLIALTASSRIFLGVHWLSDVISGILLGWLCLLLMAFYYQRYASQDIQPKKLLPVLAILQLILTIGYYQHYHQRLSEEYQLNTLPKVENIQAQTWWKKSDIHIPVTATNRFGIPRELLNIQWASNEDELISTLNQHGWKSALEQHNWVLEIQHPEEQKIPTIRLNFKIRYLNDKKPRFVYYKAIKNTTHTFLVLQLWKTDFDLQPQNNPIFVGNLSIKTDDKQIKPHISEAKMIAEFTQDLNQTLLIKTLQKNNGSLVLVKQN